MASSNRQRRRERRAGLLWTERTGADTGQELEIDDGDDYEGNGDQEKEENVEREREVVQQQHEGLEKRETGFAACSI